MFSGIGLILVFGFFTTEFMVAFSCDVQRRILLQKTLIGLIVRVEMILGSWRSRLSNQTFKMEEKFKIKAR